MAKPWVLNLLCTCMLLCLVTAKKMEDKLMNKTIERTVQLRTHSIYPPYIDQDLQNRWWDFGADAYVNTNKHIRLTQAKPSQMGWLWSRLPITASNFIVEVEFKISGESTHLFGDGLAVWLTKGRAQPGPVFGSMDRFEGLGIFMDTYANTRHSYSFPRIMAMKGDGQTVYNVGDDGDSQSMGACSANIRRTNVATRLKLTYLKDHSLDVKIQHKAWDEWSDCFTITGYNLPTAPYLGFSSLTGDVFDAHDIISVTTSSAILSNADAQRDQLRAPKIFSSGGSLFSSTWVRLILLVGFCGGAWYGYQQYLMRQRGSRGGHGRSFSFGLGARSFGGFDSKRF